MRVQKVRKTDLLCDKICLKFELKIKDFICHALKPDIKIQSQTHQAARHLH